MSPEPTSLKEISSDQASQPGYRTPPHNIDAEQALLGAILVNNEAASKVSAFLLAEHMIEPAHRLIYDAALKLIDRGQVATPVTLKPFFEHEELLDEVGGASYLVRLAAAAVTIINAEDYGRIIYDLALRRELIDLGEDMVVSAYESDIDFSATEQIEAAEEHLFGLAEKGAHEGGFKPFKRSLTDAVTNAQAAYQRDGRLTGVATGLSAMDEMLGGLHRSDLIILAGRPSMGKTALATNIAYYAALQRAKAIERGDQGEHIDGAVVGFFSLEMSAEQLATRILSERTSIASEKLRRGKINKEQFHALVRASRELEELPFFIDDTPALTISALRTRARRLKRQHDLSLVVVDYLQLLRPSRRSNQDNRVQEVSEITQGLKALAKDLDVPVLALSQLSRAVEQRENKRPQLSDLRESGSIEQDADIVMFVYREEYYHERQQPPPDTDSHVEWQEKGEKIHGIAEIIVGKQRHGPTGDMRLQFTKETTKFSNLEHQDYPRE